MRININEQHRVFTADQSSAVLESLPLAESREIYLSDGKEIKSHKAVLVGDKVVDIPSKHYVIVQHKDAFRPIINGLTEAGEHNFYLQTITNTTRAFLRAFTMKTNDGKSDILLGFQVKNSFNRTTTVDYGLSIEEGKRYVEIVGYRLLCKNGMIARVNIDEAEFVRPEVKEEVLALMKKRFTFRHSRGVNERILNVQYIVEAMTLLRGSFEAMTEKAKKITINDIQKAEELLKAHFAERVVDKILNRFSEDREVEGNSLWSLYNAITYEGSHGLLSVSQAQNIQTNASRVLEQGLKMEVI